jgi:hypothetical protein
MRSEPYGGYIEALRILVRSTASKGLPSLSEPHREISIELAVESFENNLAELAERTWQTRESIERQFAKQHQGSFRAVDSMLGVAQSVYHFLVTAALPDMPPAVRRASLTVLTRAVSIGHEVFAMLRAGFPVGAQARWRTLYELDVVAAVLLHGGRETARRYLNHYWVRVAKKPYDYFSTDEGWRGVQRKVERINMKLLRRYGRSYSQEYGWAAELTSREFGVDRPNFGHLKRLADLYWHRTSLQQAHHAVHADSFGNRQIFDGVGSPHAGARSDGVAPMCALLVRTLGEIAASTLSILQRYIRPVLLDPPRAAAERDPTLGEEGAVFGWLCDELLLVLERDALFGTHTECPGGTEPDCDA